MARLEGRHTLEDAARWAIPLALGSLSPEAMRSQELGLATLCGVESFPGAGGLLYG